MKAEPGSTLRAEYPEPLPQKGWSSVAVCYNWIPTPFALWLLQRPLEAIYVPNTPAAYISAGVSGCRADKCDKEYRERMAAVRAPPLTSCFIRHLPSSVSSALAGGVTSVAIASSSAEQRLHCESGLQRTEGDTGGLQELSWEPGDSTQNQCPGTAYPWHLFSSKKHPPLVGQEGHATGYLQLLGKCSHPPLLLSPLLRTLRTSCSNMPPVNPAAHSFPGYTGFFYGSQACWAGQNGRLLSKPIPLTQNFQHHPSLPLKKQERNSVCVHKGQERQR